MYRKTVKLIDRPELRLSFDARDEYARRMMCRPRSELPAFEDYVFEVCQVARELRALREYDRTSRLPRDGTMRCWRAQLKRLMN